MQCRTHSWPPKKNFVHMRHLVLWPVFPRRWPPGRRPAAPATAPVPQDTDLAAAG